MSFTRALIALPLTAFEDFSAIAEKEGLIKESSFVTKKERRVKSGLA